MDDGRKISEQTLSQVVRTRPMPSMPADMHQRIMKRVQLQHEKRLRRERRVFCVLAACGLLLTMGLGGRMLLRLHYASIELGEIERIMLVSLLLGILLLGFHHRFFKRLGIRD